MSEREEYMKKVQARLDQWNAEIDRLTAKAREAEADARLTYDRELARMREQRDEANAQLKRMQASSDAAWHDMKSGFDAAWDDMSRAFNNAMSRFR